MGIIRARLGQVDGDDGEVPDNVLEIELPVKTEAAFDNLEEMSPSKSAAVTAFVRALLKIFIDTQENLLVALLLQKKNIQSVGGRAKRDLVKFVWE